MKIQIVLMEYALEGWVPACRRNSPNGLNPCFNGICSRSTERGRFQVHRHVLILVLMEYALEASSSEDYERLAVSFNPRFNGICSRSCGPLCKVALWSVLILVLMECFRKVKNADIHQFTKEF